MNNKFNVLASRDPMCLADMRVTVPPQTNVRLHRLWAAVKAPRTYILLPPVHIGL